jgi:phospholipid-translocating ATPase
LTRIKFSTIEKSLNSFLLFFVGLLITEMTISTVLSLVLGEEYFDKEETQESKQGRQKLDVKEDVDDYAWYIGDIYERDFEEGFQNWLTWLVLYSYIIPISMYVSMEIQKFISAMFFGWDIKMYDEERDIPARSNTSDINEELGLVTHLFTDKTGTLTRNIMVFRRYCTADGHVRDRDQLRSEPWGPMTMVLTLCHSVQVGILGFNISRADIRQYILNEFRPATYQVTEGLFAASSPDEKALLDVCKWAGFVYRGESTNGVLEVMLPGATMPVRYKKEAELEVTLQPHP